MIVTFEKHTKTPTKEVIKKIVPKVVKILRGCKGKKKALTNAKIRYYLRNSRSKIWINSSDMRQIIHYIRVNDIIEFLIATQKGYYICSSHEELNRWVHSLYTRNRAVKENITAALRQQKESGNRLTEFAPSLATKKKKPVKKKTLVKKQYKIAANKKKSIKKVQTKKTKKHVSTRKRSKAVNTRRSKSKRRAN